MNGDERDLSRLTVVELGRRTPLPAVEQTRLAKAALAGDLDARNELVVTNGRLIIKIAMRYHGRTNIPLADLCQEGVLGFIRAVELFDPERGFRLSTYATFWVRQSIQRAVISHARNIRVPVHVGDLIGRMAVVEAEFEGLTGQPPTDAELAEALGVPARDVANARRARLLDTFPLDRPLSEDGRPLAMLVPSDADVEGQADASLLGEELREMLGRLPARTEKILRVRFGLDGRGGKTLVEIGEMYDLTRERIRQLEKEGLAAVRQMMEKEHELA